MRNLKFNQYFKLLSTVWKKIQVYLFELPDEFRRLFTFLRRRPLSPSAVPVQFSRENLAFGFRCLCPQSESVVDLGYGSPLFDFGLRITRSLKFIFQRVESHVHISALGMFPLSLATYARVSRPLYQHFWLWISLLQLFFSDYRKHCVVLRCTCRTVAHQEEKCFENGAWRLLGRVNF